MKRMRRYGRKRSYSRWRKRLFANRVRRISYGIAEKKYFEGYFTPGSHTYTGTAPGDLNNANTVVPVNWNDSQCSLLNLIPFGTGQGERIGNMIFVRYIQLVILIVVDVADEPLIGGQCRYMVIHDKNHGGNNYPQPIMQYQSTAGTDKFVTWASLKNRDQLARFKTLLDVQHLTHQTSATTVSGSRQIVHYIPVNRRIRFTTEQAGTNLQTASNLPMDDIVFQMASNSANCCRCIVYSRVCFTDA